MFGPQLVKAVCKDLGVVALCVKSLESRLGGVLPGHKGMFS